MGVKMKKTVLAVCAEDAVYLRRLAEYLGRHRHDQVEIHVFHDRDRFLSEDARGLFGAALIEEGFFPQEMIADSWILVNFAPSTLSLTLFILYYLHLVAKRDALFLLFSKVKCCTNGAMHQW